MSTTTTVTYCSITVNITNNTGQGSILFNTLSFLKANATSYDDILPTYIPVSVANVVEDNGVPAQILYTEGFSYYYDDYPYEPKSAVYPATGTAKFVMPNMELLTISWDLTDFSKANAMPIISPSGTGYTYTGLTTPTQNDGYKFTFDVTVSG